MTGDDTRPASDRAPTVSDVSDDVPGNREELRLLLAQAGLGPRQTDAWLDSPTALLSGLVPAIAITDPATASRARNATRRLLAELSDPVPDGVQVTGARIVNAGGYLLDVTFDWPGGTAVRRWDAEPYLGASRAHEPLLSDYPRFADFRIEDRTLTWPAPDSDQDNEQALDFAPEFLFSTSWDPATPGAKS